MKNALALLGQGLGESLKGAAQIFAPEEYGYFKDQRDRTKYRNALAGAGTNYGAMRQAAMEYGDVGGALQFQQMQDQQNTGRQDAERMKFERASNFLANLKTVAPEMRNQWAAENWQAGGMAELLPMPDFNDGVPDDAEIDAMMAQMNAMGGLAPVSSAPEYMKSGEDIVALQGGQASVVHSGTPKPQAQLLTPEQEIEVFGKDMPGSFQQKADGTYAQVSGTGPKTPFVQNNFNPGGDNAPPTPFEEARDKAVASDYIEWQSGGGADAMKNLSQLNQVVQNLESGDNITGPILGVVDPRVRVLFNQQSVDTQQLLEEVVQRNLRLILGAQFTQQEGERLIARAFNPQADEATNLRRVKRLFQQMEIAAQQKQAMFDYLETNRTLRGYRGTTPSLNEFYAAMDEVSEGQNSPESAWTDEKQKRLDELRAKRDAGQLQ